MSYYYRKYIQFNDLVFYSYVTNSDDTKVDFDIVKHSYTFRNGDYAPLKRRTPRIESTSVGITMEFNVKHLPCDYRPFYRRFILEQLTKAGKLWAVQGDELLWAYAIPESYSEPTFNLVKNTIEIDIEFYLPQGVWHKADKQKTFIEDFDICAFMECLDYRVLNPCCDCGHCVDKPVKCCCCDELERDEALCYNIDRLSDVYSKDCIPKFIIRYDCERAETLFTDSVNPYLGQRICRDTDESIIAGQIYVEGGIPTTDYKIVLNGGGENIWININGNANYIKGEYDGPLIITSTGNVYDGCGNLLDAEVYQVPEGNVFGFTFYPGTNSVIIEPNKCCDMQCVYVEVDNLTV